jgi:hypothetical protein
MGDRHSINLLPVFRKPLDDEKHLGHAGFAITIYVKEMERRRWVGDEEPGDEDGICQIDSAISVDVAIQRREGNDACADVCQTRSEIDCAVYVHGDLPFVEPSYGEQGAG